MNSLKKFDLSLLNRKTKVLAGVDEAGRGPLAGPVVAAAVVFPKKTEIEEVNDSKKLSEKKREALYDEIIKNCLAYGIGIVYQKEIDEINILQASLKAMKKAVESLRITPDLILIDGNKTFDCEVETKTVVHGDSKSFSIAAASILAKVTRDRIMRELATEYPEYNWHKNKGYGTREHIEALKTFGVTDIHRKTFLTKIFND